MLPPLSALCAAALVIGLPTATQAADPVVHVALLDATAMMPSYSGGDLGAGTVPRPFGMMGNRQGMMAGGGYGLGMMGSGMMTIRADQNALKAGKVILEVTNFSRSLVHAMLVVAVDGPNAPLPYDYAAQRVVEEQIM